MTAMLNVAWLLDSSFPSQARARRSCAERILQHYLPTGDAFCRGDALKLCETLNVSRRCVRRTILDLEELGAIKEVDIGRRARGGGAYYRVVPELVGAGCNETVGVAPPKEAPRRVEPVCAAPVTDAPDVEWIDAPPSDDFSDDEPVYFDTDDPSWDDFDAP